ncbi:hypothetical protein LCGC14_1126110 [marine sediment metagenome]|uniref:N-acetyltransferase domain-containing protein n=1 Tax=marine sediment metagenome TaxID=412755 RepID=A0A0F9M2K3_9ZZZZ
MMQLRQGQKSDFNFLYKLKKATLKEYIAKTWGWDEKWQKDYFSQNFKPKSIKIVRQLKNNIGCISILEEDNLYCLSLVEILPKYQNQGIGTSLIKELLSTAKKQNKPVYLQVLKTNKKAQNLYKRLCFLTEEETKTHLKMVYK